MTMTSEMVIDLGARREDNRGDNLSGPPKRYEREDGPTQQEAGTFP